MPIRLEPSGFYEWIDSPGRVPMLGVATDRLEDCLVRYREGEFRGFFGHHSFGFRQDNLDFLAGTPTASHLWFWDVELQNIEGLYHLADLEHVGINPKRPGIDFSRFPKLHTTINHWLRDDHGLEASSIKTYYLWHYKPRSKSFEGLSLPSGVQRLEFNWANPASLDGLPVLPDLEVLEFHRCRNLCDLSALPRIAPNLRTFATTTCTRLSAASVSIQHPTIQFLVINGKSVP